MIIKGENVIDKPEHYHKGGIDVIEFAKMKFSHEEVRGFFRINILKYTTRFDLKNGEEDLKKAEFYIKALAEWEAGKKND